MAITASHRFGRVSGKFVDDSLVDALRGQCTNEGVPEDVIALEHRPFRPPLRFLPFLRLGILRSAGVFANEAHECLVDGLNGSIAEEPSSLIRQGREHFPKQATYWNAA